MAGQHLDMSSQWRNIVSSKAAGKQLTWQQEAVNSRSDVWCLNTSVYAEWQLFEKD